MLPPGVEPGSRTDLVLTRYKRAALPVELQEPISSQNKDSSRDLNPDLSVRCDADTSFSRRFLHLSYGSKLQNQNESGGNRTHILQLKRLLPCQLGHGLSNLELIAE